ncbi:hypothetical protein CLOSPI_00744 [Thomasclavelia spiroformis DSM 1552]|uniref:Uncharacterized protein n=2 Tax=Thomasclavelia spiroformis TaxID=29348 RepID=B1C0L5_9FIRM|nr:hypothetical protein CLOSPI_00744 [Thomasclavelia spiroformis DSM 1552]
MGWNMKFNRVIFNRIILGLIALLQTIHLICQIRKDYFIGTENLSQLQIKQQIEMSSIQGPISYILQALITTMVFMVIITWYKKDVSRLLKEDIILIISLFVVSYIIMNIFSLAVGNTFESILRLPLIGIVFIICLYIKTDTRLRKLA